MNMPQNRLKWQRAAFFLLMALVFLPVVIFPFISANFHSLYSAPKVENGVLDVSGYDFLKNREIPLDGDWEFFWNRWIVTDGEENPEPDMMMKVPKTWKNEKLNGKPLPQTGYASYRLRLKNCQSGVELISYVPNLGASYRVFFNDKEIAASGVMSKTPQNEDVVLGLRRENLRFPHGADNELVIEISSSNVGGLYLTPLLAEDDRNYILLSLRGFANAISIGMILLAAFAFLVVTLLRKNDRGVWALMAMDTLILLRILLKDDSYEMLKMIVPVFRYYDCKVVLHIASLFLPVVFLVCAKGMMGVPIPKKVTRNVALFEAVLSVPMFVFMLNGHPLLSHYIGAASLLPLAYILVLLYRSMEKHSRALIVAAETMLLISSILVGGQYSSGLLVMNVSLYPSTVFTIAVMLQICAYIKGSNMLYEKALESANLRLLLRENETALMLSQIKPHFLYNALLAIQVLCTREPETAGDAVGRFANYLRANMRSIDSSAPIPFSEELEHIKNYVSIEQLRFQDRLRVVYEVNTQAFSVPPLTIQPLVENAIKHGACKRVRGGTVTLKTWEECESFCVSVTDDGPGFDAKAFADPKMEHHGLANIRFRLKELCGAALSVESEPDKGTVALVRIPKEKP